MFLLTYCCGIKCVTATGNTVRLKLMSLIVFLVRQRFTSALQEVQFRTPPFDCLHTIARDILVEYLASSTFG